MNDIKQLIEKARNETLSWTDRQDIADTLERLTQPVGVEPIGERTTKGWYLVGDQIAYVGHIYSAETVARLQASNAQLQAERDELVSRLKAIDKETYSHVDGRDLFAQFHPRNTLDIKRRVDGRETWFEGDWLSNLYSEIKKARVALAKIEGSKS